MDKTELLEKYTDLYRQDPGAAELAMIEEGLQEPEIAELTKELDKVKPKKSKPATTAQQQANHPTLKWFDEFEVRILKIQVRNPLLGKMETIITGWELVKKLHPKFIEPHVARDLNAFANGYDPNGLGKYLIPKETMKSGEVITYKQYAKALGINEAEDINILLNPNK